MSAIIFSKISTSLYELKNTKMKSMIVEVCFIEATEYVTLYKQLGADVIGKSIVESIANKKGSCCNCSNRWRNLL